jgi:hypothetical protein
MKPVYIYYGIVCILMTSCHAIEPITVITGVFSTSSFIALAVLNTMFPIFEECCTKKWINLNDTGIISLHIYIVSG